MHISEGIITGVPAIASSGIGLGLMALGARRMQAFVEQFPHKKALLGMAGAFIFFLSLIPIPAYNGITTSHPCGTPLAGILFGPIIGTALAGLSLALQAAFFAHGGFSTWGVNLISLGVVGAGSAWLVFTLARKLRLPIWCAGALGGFTGNIMTYVATGLILAWWLAQAPTPKTDFTGYLLMIYGAYLPVQLPIAIGELFLTGFALHYISVQRPEVLESLRVIKSRSVSTATAATATMLGLILCLCLLPAQPIHAQEAPTLVAQTTGIDQAVNEQLAEEAGVPAKKPLIDTEGMGDLWNALLLLGGGAAGFVLGRNWHLLFSKRNAPTLESQKD